MYRQVLRCVDSTGFGYILFFSRRQYPRKEYDICDQPNYHREPPDTTCPADHHLEDKVYKHCGNTATHPHNPVPHSIKLVLLTVLLLRHISRDNFLLLL